MTEGMVLDLARNALTITLQLSLPILVISLVSGLIVSVFQAVTQINEMTLSFIPKLVGIFAMTALAGPWMIMTLVDYVRRLFQGIPGIVG